MRAEETAGGMKDIEDGYPFSWQYDSISQSMVSMSVIGLLCIFYV